MRNIFTFLLFIIAVLFLLPSCKSSSGLDQFPKNTVYMIPESKPIKLSDEQREYVKHNNQFALRLFGKINKEMDKQSTIYSPISITYLLGMLNSGATGGTREQITNVLGFGDDAKGLNEFCAKMIKESPFADSGVTIETANSINVNSAMGFKLLPTFEKDMQTYYQAQISALDFDKKSSLNKINDWCNKHTHGMVPKILDELDKEGIMVLLNAIYLKATWKDKFDPEQTKTRDFTMDDGNKQKMDLMHRDALALFGENEDFSTLCLPYGDKGYCMYVILPAEGKTTKDVLSNLDNDKLNEAINRLYETEVDILLPKFGTESEIELNDILSDMGMDLAFNRNAGFSDICTTIVYVSKMKQKARIDVDEEGTKAAAVTVAEMGVGGAVGTFIQRKKADFHADRPFLYLIREMSTGTIFFMGKYIGK